MNIKEFMSLPYSERAEAYKELNDHDRFLVRISEPIKPNVVGHREITDEDRKIVEYMKKEVERMRKNKP